MGREQETSAPMASARSENDLEVVLILDAATHGNQDIGLGDIHIADFGGHGFQISPFGRQIAGVPGFIHHLTAGGLAFIRLKRSRPNRNDGAGAGIHGIMGADRAAVFLPHHVEGGAVFAVYADHIRYIGRIHLDGKPRAQIDAEGVMGKQQHAVARQDIHQCLANTSALG
jgi:hypothetical protein